MANRPVRDLPVVKDWVLASEAAAMAGVSRQYIHAQRDQFHSASQLSGFLAFRRAEIERWTRKRNETLTIEP